ncbi:MAG: LysR substrate-binding domain-containing protein [Pseudomonadota bacterium]
MVDPPRFPSLASIRAFECAARLGSFTQAARELGTSPASVSYHVRQLEMQIGVPLFRRHPHKVELTEPGALVAQETVNAFAVLRASFVRAAELDEGKLALTTLPTFGTSWLIPRLGLFRAQHPEIMVDLDLSAEAQDLGGGGHDAAIRNGHGRWPGLRTIRLMPSLFAPLCAPALKAAVAGLADPHLGADVPLLGRPDWWALWYHALGHPDAVLSGRFGTRLAAEHLDVAGALAGHGIAMGSPLLFAQEIAAGRLVLAHDLVIDTGRSFWLTFPVTRQRSTKIARFRDWVCEEAARACDAGADLIGGAVLMEGS